MELVGAVDIGGTKIAVGLVDNTGQIYEQEVCPTEPERGFSDGLERIEKMFRVCAERRPADRVIGVGVGSTGPVDPNTGVLGPNSFLPLWEGHSMIDRLESLFGLPVAIENDADAASLAEAAWGAGKDARICLYVTVSTGIGCGIVINGALYRGADGAHPELGHMVIDANADNPCYCGGRGCWESLASGPAMALWYQQQRPPGGRIGKMDAREICSRAVQGEPLAEMAAAREGRYLGIGLANLITIFVPDVVVLGGGVMGSWVLFEKHVRSLIRQNCGLVPYEKTSLRLAALGAQTGLVGAARVWFHRFAR